MAHQNWNPKTLSELEAEKEKDEFEASREELKEYLRSKGELPPKSSFEEDVYRNLKEGTKIGVLNVARLVPLAKEGIASLYEGYASLGSKLTSGKIKEDLEGQAEIARTMQDFYKEKNKWAKEKAEGIEKRNEEPDENSTMGEFWSPALRGTAGSVVQAIPLIPAGPYGMAAGFGVTEANDARFDAEEKGLEGWDKVRYVALEGTIEAGISMLFTKFGKGGFEALMTRSGRVTNQGIKSLLKETGVSMLEELPEEVVTEVAHNVNKSLSDIEPEAATPENLLKTIKQTVAQTVLQMGMGAAKVAPRAAVESLRGVAFWADESEGFFRIIREQDGKIMFESQSADDANAVLRALNLRSRQAGEIEGAQIFEDASGRREIGINFARGEKPAKPETKTRITLPTGGETVIEPLTSAPEILPVAPKPESGTPAALATPTDEDVDDLLGERKRERERERAVEEKARVERLKRLSGESLDSAIAAAIEGAGVETSKSAGWEGMRRRIAGLRERNAGKSRLANIDEIDTALAKHLPANFDGDRRRALAAKLYGETAEQSSAALARLEAAVSARRDEAAARPEEVAERAETARKKAEFEREQRAKADRARAEMAEFKAQFEAERTRREAEATDEDGEPDWDNLTYEDVSDLIRGLQARRDGGALPEIKSEKARALLANPASEFDTDGSAWLSEAETRWDELHKAHEEAVARRDANPNRDTLTSLLQAWVSRGKRILWNEKMEHYGEIKVLRETVPHENRKGFQGMFRHTADADEANSSLEELQLYLQGQGYSQISQEAGNQRSKMLDMIRDAYMGNDEQPDHGDEQLDFKTRKRKYYVPPKKFNELHIRVHLDTATKVLESAGGGNGLFGEEAEEVNPQSQLPPAKETTVDEVEAWLEGAEAIRDPLGQTVIIANPERVPLGIRETLRARAQHLLEPDDGGSEHTGQRAGEIDPQKEKTVYLIPETVKKPDLIATLGSRTYYVRKYGTGANSLLHLVLTIHNRLITQFPFSQTYKNGLRPTNFKDKDGTHASVTYIRKEKSSAFASTSKGANTPSAGSPTQSAGESDAEIGKVNKDIEDVKGIIQELKKELEAAIGTDGREKIQSEIDSWNLTVAELEAEKAALLRRVSPKPVPPDSPLGPAAKGVILANARREFRGLFGERPGGFLLLSGNLPAILAERGAPAKAQVKARNADAVIYRNIIALAEGSGFNETTRDIAESITHEAGHAYWGTLSPKTKTRLTNQFRREMDSHTGPFFDEKGRRTSKVSGVYSKPREWFAERCSVINAHWAEGKITSAQPTTLLGKAAKAIRDFLRGIFERIADIRTPARKRIFEHRFRRFMQKGSRSTNIAVNFSRPSFRASGETAELDRALDDEATAARELGAARDVVDRAERAHKAAAKKARALSDSDSVVAASENAAAAARAKELSDAKDAERAARKRYIAARRTLKAAQEAAANRAKQEIASEADAAEVGEVGDFSADDELVEAYALEQELSDELSALDEEAKTNDGQLDTARAEQYRDAQTALERTRAHIRTLAEKPNGGAMSRQAIAATYDTRPAAPKSTPAPPPTATTSSPKTPEEPMAPAAFGRGQGLAIDVQLRPDAPPSVSQLDTLADTELDDYIDTLNDALSRLPREHPNRSALYDARNDARLQRDERKSRGYVPPLTTADDYASPPNETGDGDAPAAPTIPDPSDTAPPATAEETQAAVNDAQTPPVPETPIPVSEGGADGKEFGEYTPKPRFTPSDMGADPPVKGKVRIEHTRGSKSYLHAEAASFVPEKWGWARGVWKVATKAVTGFASAMPELPTFGRDARKYQRVLEGYLEMKHIPQRAEREARDTVASILSPINRLKNKLHSKEYEEMMRVEQRCAQIQKEISKIKEESHENYKIPQLESELSLKEKRLERLNKILENDAYFIFGRFIMYRNFMVRQDELKDERTYTQTGVDEEGRPEMEAKPIKMPFGLSPDEVRRRAKYWADKVRTHPDSAAIREAIKRHGEAMVATIEAAKKNGSFKQGMWDGREFYFPHIVLDFARGKLRNIHADTEDSFRAFFVRPVGSRRAIETDYIKAMMIHLTDSYSADMKEDAINNYFKPYDISSKVRYNWDKYSKDGLDGKDKTWDDFIPNGYEKFVPHDVVHFHLGIEYDRAALGRALGIVLGQGDLRAELTRHGFGDIFNLPIPVHHFQSALIKDAKEIWILPSPVAEALRNMRQREDSKPSLVSKVARGVVTGWKWMKLFFIPNTLRYNFNNYIADTFRVIGSMGTGEAIKTGLVATMQIPLVQLGFLRHPVGALGEVHAFFTGDESRTTQDVRDAFRYGVFQTPTENELQRLKELPGFEAVNQNKSTAKAILKKIWEGGVEFSSYREAVYRYALYKHNLERYRNGSVPNYGGAYWRTVENMGDSAPDIKDAEKRKSAAISLATLNNYSALSVNGNWLRRALIPFFAFRETSMKWMVNTIRNSYDMLFNSKEFAQGTAHPVRSIASAVTGMWLRMMLPLLLVQWWNEEREDENGESLEGQLSEDIHRRPHLILGKWNGKIHYLLLENDIDVVFRWFGGGRAAAAIGDIFAGRTNFTTGALNWASNIWRDALNEAASLGPQVTAPYTTASGQVIFPDVTNQRRLPGNEVKWAVLSQLDQAGTMLARSVVDKDYYAPKDFGTWATQVVGQIRSQDPNQAAYYYIRERADEFRTERTGKQPYRPPSGDEERKQAMRSWRRAINAGDVEAATRLYVRLLEHGQTAESFVQTISGLDPLHSLSKADGTRKAFTDSLDGYGRAQLARAYEYYGHMSNLRTDAKELFPRRGRNDAATARNVERFRASANDAQRQETLRRALEAEIALGDEERRKSADRDLRQSLRK
jgi:hypothetical protein